MKNSNSIISGPYLLLQIIVTLIVLGNSGAVAGAVTSARTDDFHPSDYQLMFNEEFNGKELDRNRWCTRYVYGGGPRLQVPDPECTLDGRGTLDFFNDEQQRYVDRNIRGEVMHQVTGGALKLRATHSRKDDTYASFESSMIRSKATYRPDDSTSYYITARLWLPAVVGTWPAFWLTPIVSESGEGIWPPEIDILEGAINGVEDKENMIHMGVKQQNWGGSGTKGSAEATYTAPGFELKYYNFHAPQSLRGRWIEMGLEWTSDSACFFLDGSKILCEVYRWKDNAGKLAPPSPILINLAIGGQWAGRHGVNKKGFPTMLQVEHVRVYQQKGKKTGMKTSTKPNPPVPLSVTPIKDN